MNKLATYKKLRKDKHKKHKLAVRKLPMKKQYLN